jgi:hypothetical protein
MFFKVPAGESNSGFFMGWASAKTGHYTRPVGKTSDI